MNIANILKLKILKNAQLLAGEQGLNNKVLNPSIIDAPDGYKWFKEGDFILSTCFPFIENGESEKGLLNYLKLLVGK